MAREAISTRSHAPALAERQKHHHEKRKREKNEVRHDELKSLTFEQMSKTQRDQLLKTIAIKMGLIEDSDD
jgi:hypothetical protein